MKKIIVVFLVIFLVFGSLLFAAGGDEEPTTATGTDEPQYGGTVTNFLNWAGIEATTADVTQSLWPAPLYASAVIDFLITGDADTYGPGGTNEFSFQIERDPPEEFCQGAIAESWGATKDKLTFNIRQGVYWAAEGKEHVMESRELTAEDVAWSLNRFLDSTAAGDGAKRTENGGWIESVYVDGSKVIVETSSFNANWLFEIGKGWANGIYAPEVVEADASDWDNLVGTGPFMVKEYVTGLHLAYERNPIYWDTATIDGKEYEIPFIDELIWPMITDESTQIAALRTGKIDVHYTVPPEYMDTLKKSSPELLTSPWPHVTMKYAALRCDQPPFDNKNVRRAMMMSIDREAIMKAVFRDGDIYGWPISAALTGAYTPRNELPAQTAELFEFNPEKAKQILADEGYPDGFAGVEITAPTREQDYVDMATMISAYWGDVGVEATVNPMEVTALTAYWRAGKHDVLMGNMSNANPIRTFSDGFTPGVNNRSYYENPELTKLVRQAEQTVDVAERNAILKKIAVIGLDDVPYIPIAVEKFVATWWPWIKNYYGGMEASAWAPAYLMTYAWMDQDLKSAMGK